MPNKQKYWKTKDTFLRWEAISALLPTSEETNGYALRPGHRFQPWDPPSVFCLHSPHPRCSRAVMRLHTRPHPISSRRTCWVVPGRSSTRRGSRECVARMQACLGGSRFFAPTAHLPATAVPRLPNLPSALAARDFRSGHARRPRKAVRTPPPSQTLIWTRHWMEKDHGRGRKRKQGRESHRIYFRPTSRNECDEKRRFWDDFLLTWLLWKLLSSFRVGTGLLGLGTLVPEGDERGHTGQWWPGSV